MPDLRRWHLQYLAEHGRSEEARSAARRELEAFEGRLGILPRDQQLHRLQVAALTKRAKDDRASEDDFVKLGRPLVKRSRIEGDLDATAMAERCLETGRKKFPKSVQILELVIALYFSSSKDNDPRLEAALRSLEALAPNSSVLDIFEDVERKDAEQFRAQIWDQIGDLLQKAQSREPTIMEAALNELRRIVTQYGGPFYRSVLALALMITRQKEEGLAVARQITDVRDDHTTHLHAFRDAGGRYLVERFAVTYCSSLSSLAYSLRNAPGSGAARQPTSVFCAAVAARDYERLELFELDDEIFNKAGWSSVTTLTGLEATTDRILVVRI